MGFCKLSSELIENKHTTIENTFITEFLPNIDPLSLKVYLFGLYLSQTGADHSLQDFENAFNLSTDDVISLFKNLQELNLVDCLDLNEFEVRYLPIKKSSMFLAKYDVKKYKQFNLHAQSVIKRLIDINEYNQYYYQIEKYNLEQDAVVKTIEYCVSKKGEHVSANYILTVLRNWARENIKTVEDVENRINQEERYNDDIKLVLNAMGIKRVCSMEEKQMFFDWTDNLDFKVDTLVHLAKITKKKKGNFARLDGLINKCFELKLLSTKEIDDYFVMEEQYYTTAKIVCKNLGVRYDNLQIVVETFVSNWHNLGYQLDALDKLSLYCFKSGIKTLQGLDMTIQKMFTLGIISLDAINNHINELTSFDSAISKILLEFGLDRYVNKFDRQFYNTWINEWHISQDILTYVIELSKNKIQPMQFANRVLSIYHNKNIKTLEEAKKEKLDFENTYTKAQKPKSSKMENTTYTKEQLTTLIDTVNEVEL